MAHRKIIETAAVHTPEHNPVTNTIHQDVPNNNTVGSTNLSNTTPLTIHDPPVTVSPLLK